MYNSPVNLIFRQLETKIEDEIITAIQYYDIKVDKEELLRALAYDRDQYDKGYADAKRDLENDLLKIIIDKNAKTIYNTLS